MAKMGRKTGYRMPATIDKALVREALFMIVAEHLNEMVAAQIDAAKGFALIDKSDENGLRTYEVAPNPMAFKTLIEQVLGKPPQPLEHSGKDGAPLIPVVNDDLRIKYEAELRHRLLTQSTQEPYVGVNVEPDLSPRLDIGESD